LLIRSARIFDSSVERGIPSRAVRELETTEAPLHRR